MVPLKKCSIGIYGKWGTGKTTLMKLVEAKLKPTIFCWDKIVGQDKSAEQDTLKKYLYENFHGNNDIDIAWINCKDKEFKKFTNENDRYPQTITITNDDDDEISIKLTEKRKAMLEINHRKIYEFTVEEEKIFYEERQNNNSNHNAQNISPYLSNVKENDILTVWFNAWRYEREEQFAVIPLLKTIAYAMGEHPFYKNIKPILLRGLEILSKDIIRNLATRYILTKEGMDEFEKNLIPKLERIPEIDKDTIYFDGIKKIEDEIHNIREKYPRSRIVVFIDDLDRCSPETAVEVFESIKVFLDIEGFVFILGLSRDLLDKMIKIKLEKAGLKDIEAEDYVRKIIQIEINIQDWNDESIGELIKSLSKRLDKIHHEGVEKCQDLILKAVAQNPRQTKRFINNFIVASSAKPELNARVYFCREVIVNKWPEFYNNLRSDENFRNLIVDYLNKQVEFRKKDLEEDRQKDKKTLSISEQRLLEIVDPLWDFLDEEEKKSNAFSEIVKDWQKLESIGESLKGSGPTKYDGRDYAIIAQNVFRQLCNTDPKSQDINRLAAEVGAYDNRNDVAYIAEQVLLQQLQFIERDSHSNNVRLTPLGRKNCGKDIYIPPADIQKLRMRFNI